MLAGKWLRVAAGALSLVGAVVAYYVTDALVLHEPLSGFSGFAAETVVWCTAGTAFGLFLGLVGVADQAGTTGSWSSVTQSFRSGGHSRLTSRG
ncbi:hypothetical protein [Streptomyces sp. NPDC054863]